MEFAYALDTVSWLCAEIAVQGYSKSCDVCSGDSATTANDGRARPGDAVLGTDKSIAASRILQSAILLSRLPCAGLDG